MYASRLQLWKNGRNFINLYEDIIQLRDYRTFEHLSFLPSLSQY